jgi:type IV fimbrial biogenesis protein FimT
MIELMTVISVAAVVAAVGIPSYRYVTTTNRISGEINNLLGDLQYARYEALKEGLPVTVCPAASVSITTCDTTSVTWSEGWIVLSNAGSGYGAATVLRRQRPFTSMNSSDTMTGTAATNPTTFNREGFVTSGAAKFTLKDPTANSGFTRCLIVSPAGAMTTTITGKTFYSVLC